MFEKEAVERVRDYIIKSRNCLMQPCKTLEDCQQKELEFDEVVKLVKEGAEFGYNKANEWHDINDTKPSKEQLGKQLLIRLESVIGDTDYDYLVYKHKGENITDVHGIIAWKEIEK